MKESERKIKVFGAALDANDDPMKIMAKYAYINRLARGLVGPDDNFLDPYEGVLKYSTILKNPEFIKLGKVSIPSWITPRPNIDDYHAIDPFKYQEFCNMGLVRDISAKVEEYVSSEVLPDIPLMIGVDHSQTGGVLSTLSKKYGAKDILVIIFDAHFDSIPAGISLELAKFVIENKDKTNMIVPTQICASDLENMNLIDNYSCASFIDYLIKEGTLFPENIIIFGCQDYPNEEMVQETDLRARNYVEYYLSLERKGVKIIPALEDRPQMIKKLSEILSKSKFNLIYISLDVDVAMYKEVLAARFVNAIGIEMDVVLRATKLIKDYLGSLNARLIGLDIMEIETLMLNKTLKNTDKKDKTIEFIDEFLKILF
ncbi:MAG: arginase family protein [Promethearchaeota archaeon]